MHAPHGNDKSAKPAREMKFMPPPEKDAREFVARSGCDGKEHGS
jgi:hypothetical protein